LFDFKVKKKMKDGSAVQALRITLPQWMRASQQKKRNWIELF
jgi:hypothetical protein